ncbi:nucleotidyl transferase AbiEii/AbiGii toxin family protein [Patescibacteria group bacterium]|nr:nucleotidyl transferase AbiEii/AbiGii toxin family protein [Patescibacteria group bacterium]MBU1472671.1 nucleotidyl transferase AbiEii/AbiGii toxin family protein [Patescibacteria group bacterium]
MPIVNKGLWEQILSEGERTGIPRTKKRGIIREFLQTQILYHLYDIKESRYFIFTGGTSLRFLYDNKRLSEDLDFDLFKKDLPVKAILEKIIKKQTGNEKNLINFKFKSNEDGATAYFKYKTLLFDLGISQMMEEKLVIKFDFTFPKDKINPVEKIFSKFGFLQTALTYDPSTLLSFKTRALFTRKMKRGRDLYDIAKLLSRNIEPNFKVKFLKDKGIKAIDDYFLLLKKWYAKNQKLLPQLKKQVQPFLIDEEELKYIDLIFKK